jgi:putative FmdB family regulatory protein
MPICYFGAPIASELLGHMPIYEYRCESCGKTFEKIRRMSDADRDAECPDCKSQAAKRVVSGFAMSGCGPGPGGRFT